jgi:hypothetical protein
MQIRRLVLGALGTVCVLAAAAPAFADPYDWRRHEWREHQWREHEWREHERRERHGWYGPPVYVPPPAYGYYPPPPVTYGYGWR